MEIKVAKKAIQQQILKSKMDLAKEFIEENKTIEENYNLDDDMDQINSFKESPSKHLRNKTS